MIPWTCSRCGDDQIAFRHVPAEALCHTCLDAQRPPSFTEADAGIPERYRNLTRATWEAHFRRPWPQAVEHWTGTPHWIALWGPTGTGKTGLAIVLLAEHIRAGRWGHWISGPELSRRIRRDFNNAEDVLDPLLVTPLLVLDEPLTGATADWYAERILLLTRSRDERGLPTIVTSQQLPELLDTPTPVATPPVLSRWLSGLHLPLEGGDIRLQKAL
jgi:hypothetical protein